MTNQALIIAVNGSPHAGGELSGQKAFMEGQYKVEGDMSLLLRMKSFFRN